MSIEELCALPVADLAAPDSALFLWATFPQLPEALRLIEAWGFTYKSVAFVWLKKNKKADSWFYGLGFWTRGNAEICLLATKGHPKRQAANIHQFIISPIEAHTIIGQCVGGARYDRAKDYLKCALGYGCGLLVILSVLVVGFSKQLSGLFVKSDAVAAIVGTYFLIVSVGYILNTVTNCYLGALNGMGKPSKSMFLMIFYYIVVRMPLAYLLSYLGFGLNGIWVAVLVSHVVASVAAGISGTIAIKKQTSTT